jgi:hypothetical protein
MEGRKDGLMEGRKGGELIAGSISMRVDNYIVMSHWHDIFVQLNPVHVGLYSVNLSLCRGRMEPSIRTQTPSRSSGSRQN